MNPWKTLNIKPTDDKKAIKKAYAVLIKQYKPDEHPEKFQEIQAAYKMALSMRQWQEQQSDADSEQSEPQQVLKQGSQKTEESFPMQQAAEIDEEALAEQQKQEQLIEKLFNQLHQMAFAPLVVKSKLDNWKFIEDYYKIDDLTLKSQVARDVFKKVAEYNIFQQRQNNTYLIRPKIMQYLDSVFDWNSQWNEYQYKFPKYYFTVTIDIFNNTFNTSNWFESVFLLLFRSLAFLVDVFIFAIIGFLFSEILLPNYKNVTAVMILEFIMFYSLSEIFLKNHVSIGKKYIGLIVLDKFGNICDKDCTFGRHFTFQLVTLIPFYLFFLGIIPNEKVFKNFISLFTVANAVSFIMFKQLIHDLVTSSFVRFKK
jgi:hypothetical protein